MKSFIIFWFLFVLSTEGSICILGNWCVFDYPIDSDLLLDGLLIFSSTDFSICIYKKTSTDVYCSIKASGAIEYTNSSLIWKVNRCKTSNDNCKC